MDTDRVRGRGYLSDGPRRQPPCVDPQVTIRWLLIELAGGCQHCGSVPHADPLFREMRISHQTLREFLRARRRITYGVTLEKIEWWVWKQLRKRDGNDN